jgi:hypothetical protein
LFEQLRPIRISIIVNWLKKIMALALVAVWPLAMNHCKLETVPGLTFLHTADHSESQGGCGTDGCPTVESGSYRAEDQQAPVAAVVVLDFQPIELLLPTPPHAPSVSSSQTAAPPEISVSRQFVFRTASPPRAPSLAS